MIRVDSDVAAEWGARGWPALAERSARAAVAHSAYAALVDSRLAVEVSVKFTGDSEVQALNAAYRNRNQPTNVLSFPMQDAELLRPLASADNGEILLGDVVLAHGVCASEAADRRISLEEHAAHLVAHGVLHLLGYDHDYDVRADEMETVEREALASIGVADPYAIIEVQT